MDLVISATHGRSGLKRLLLGSVTERLMRTLSCPLMIVHGKESGDLALSTEVFKLKRILVGYDFSKDSDLALKYALSMAQEFEAELHLAHVVEPPVYQDIQVANGSSAPVTEQSRMPQLIEKLKQMIPEDARNWCTVAPVLLEGKADKELARYADQNDIDLIALGVRGHGLVETLFVGSTTDRVARRASCPVLSVPVEVKKG
ncbi:MAG: universal stress protein [Deltaproteobacteria bacterium]|nr:universal stress protein [Deltaproteobacteria bacterium]